MASTVRIGPETHALLKRTAEEEGISMQDALRIAVESYRRQRILADTNRAYASIREKQEEYSGVQEVIHSMDGTLLDGLEDE